MESLKGESLNRVQRLQRDQRMFFSSLSGIHKRSNTQLSILPIKNLSIKDAVGRDYQWNGENRKYYFFKCNPKANSPDVARRFDVSQYVIILSCIWCTDYVIRAQHNFFAILQSERVIKRRLF